MNRRIILITLLSLLAGCTVHNMDDGAEYFAQSQTELKRSQIPVVTANGKDVYVLRGEIRPERLGSLPPTEVEPGALISIQFKYPPKEQRLRIQEWHNGQHRWLKTDGLQFQLPDEPGLYLYNIHLQWGKRDQITGSYSIFLEAK